MRQLQDALTEEFGMDFGEWYLAEAWDLSRDDKVIVGSACRSTDSLHQRTPFIVTLPVPLSSIPDPGAVTPLGFAVLLFLQRRRQW
jgi:hypothetical protein